MLGIQRLVKIDMTLVFIDFTAYHERDINKIMPQMSGHNCDHALVPVTSQEGFPMEAMFESRSRGWK